MARQNLLILIFSIALFSCDPNKGNKSDLFTKVYTADNIPTQTYSIDPNIDNIITGKNGTRIRIPRNSFVDSTGQIISDSITISLKEVLTREEMVLGNLTTTYKGKPLETGGMLYVDATSNAKRLKLAENKSLLVALPTDSTLHNMSLFSGIQDSAGIKWENPISISLGNADTSNIPIESFEKTTNIMYFLEGYDAPKDYPDSVVNEVGRIAWEGDGLKISKDSTFKIGKNVVVFLKQDTLLKWDDVFPEQKGTNYFIEDPNTSYIFELKELGWANIDRLLADPRTKEIELITTIENQQDFEFIYVTLITQRMYLPGYQKKDYSFGFSHGDEEPQYFPVGETATIMATAYKKDKPYFAFQKIILSEKQNVILKLTETTVEKLKAIVKEHL